MNRMICVLLFSIFLVSAVFAPTVHREWGSSFDSQDGFTSFESGWTTQNYDWVASYDINQNRLKWLSGAGTHGHYLLNNRAIRGKWQYAEIQMKFPNGIGNHVLLSVYGNSDITTFAGGYFAVIAETFFAIEKAWSGYNNVPTWTSQTIVLDHAKVYRMAISAYKTGGSVETEAWLWSWDTILEKWMEEVHLAYTDNGTDGHAILSGDRCWLGHVAQGDKAVYLDTWTYKWGNSKVRKETMYQTWADLGEQQGVDYTWGFYNSGGGIVLAALGDHADNGAYIIRSTNDGIDWSEVTNFTQYRNVKDYDVLNIVKTPNHLLAGYARLEPHTGYFWESYYFKISYDGGITWSQSPVSSIPFCIIDEFGIIYTENNTVFATTVPSQDPFYGINNGGKIYRSTNNGIDWTNVYISPTQVMGQIIYAGKDSSAPSGALFVATGYTADPQGEGYCSVVKSVDGGTTWTDIGKVGNETHIYGIFYTKHNGQHILLAGTANYDGGSNFYGPGKIFRSTSSTLNGLGVSWTEVAVPFAGNYGEVRQFLDLGDGVILCTLGLYTSLPESGWIMISRDWGVTWENLCHVGGNVGIVISKINSANPSILIGSWLDTDTATHIFRAALPKTRAKMGTWYTIGQSATKLDKTTYDAEHGWYYIENFAIAKDGTYYILIDPRTFETGKSASIISLTTFYQTQPCNIYYPIIYKLDESYNEITHFDMVGGPDFQTTGLGSTVDYNNGIKYLIEIKEKGGGDGYYNLKWIPY